MIIYSLTPHLRYPATLDRRRANRKNRCAATHTNCILNPKWMIAVIYGNKQRMNGNLAEGQRRPDTAPRALWLSRLYRVAYRRHWISACLRQLGYIPRHRHCGDATSCVFCWLPLVHTNRWVLGDEDDAIIIARLVHGARRCDRSRVSGRDRNVIGLIRTGPRVYHYRRMQFSGIDLKNI